MTEDHNKFVGPGKLFETEEEEFAEKIAFMEWATQVPPEEVMKLRAAIAKELRWRQEQGLKE